MVESMDLLKQTSPLIGHTIIIPDMSEMVNEFTVKYHHVMGINARCLGYD
jgi:hypothetical protein